jgi:hypothetical protein
MEPLGKFLGLDNLDHQTDVSYKIHHGKRHSAGGRMVSLGVEWYSFSDRFGDKSKVALKIIQ